MRDLVQMADASIGAIILAAGGATRMGVAKQLLVYKGKTLLARSVNGAMSAGCKPIVVVLGCAADSVKLALADLPVTTVVNADWERGIGSSIRAGIRRLVELQPKCEAAIIQLCDQALIDDEVLRNLIASRSKFGKPICVSSFEQSIGPPVLVGCEFFAQLSELPDSQGAKAIWSQNRNLVCEVPCAGAAMDVDTPEDFRRLCDSSQ